jgi:hypothetical protein
MENYPDYESIEYHLVYSELIKAARNRGTVTYQELAHVVGLPLSGSYMGKRLGEILGAVSQNEFNYKRPMLSAIAVNVGGKVSDGFFVIAVELGLLKSDEPQERQAFLAKQRQEIYEIWKQRFHKG